MKNYLSVKGFSELSGIEASTLRYWDEIGLFSPAKRDTQNNYRYYSADQVISVNFITVLSSLNVPLKKISELKNCRDPESVIDLIERQETLLDMEMKRLRECYSIIHTRRDIIKRGLRVDENTISVKKLEERRFIVGAPNNWEKGEPFYEPFMRFCRNAESSRINLSYPVGGLHSSMEKFLAAPGEPEHFFSIDSTGNSKRHAGDYLVGYSRGGYGQFGDLPEKMASYAQENGLICHGAVYAVFLHDEICIKNPKNYLSQVCVAVKK